MLDYYNLLGLAPTAPPERIRSAFRRLAKGAHPDAHPHLRGEEKEVLQRRFIQLAHAYETLSDPQRRAEYDRRLRSARAAGTVRGAAAAGRPSRPPPRGAASGPRPAGRTGGPPPQPEKDAELDELLGDVQDLLQRFGLDMRNQFADMVDQLLAWAVSVFVEVVQTLDGERARQGPQSGQGAQAHRPGPEDSQSHRARPEPSQAHPPGAEPPAEEALEAELAALKREVRSSRRRAAPEPPTTESVERELERIRKQTGKKS